MPPQIELRSLAIQKAVVESFDEFIFHRKHQKEKQRDALLFLHATGTPSAKATLGDIGTKRLSFVWPGHPTWRLRPHLAAAEAGAGLHSSMRSLTSPPAGPARGLP